MSGDIAKIFKNEEPKAPGVFAVEPPPAAATLLAREVIQNSWDAAEELRQIDPHVPQFHIEFRFRELVGDAKRSLVDALALESLADRVAVLDRSKIGLGAHDCLATIHVDSEPLRVLQITEHAASGMYGPWDQNKSHMYLALLSIGFTEKLSGAGGSYGYGKAGLINSSRIRSVVAYSCFRERDDESGVTRRLLGVTYWGPHDFDGVNHPGIGTWSAGSAGAIRPYQNEAADQMATKIGLTPRSSTNPEELGTTFLVLDTPVDPGELVRAIERSWWPAILEGDFAVSIVDVDGSTLNPRPMRDPVLHTFIDAWEIAIGRRTPADHERHAKLSGPPFPMINGKPAFPHVGTLGLVSDLTGWSYADALTGPDDHQLPHRSLVALTRGPKMVVEYLEAGSSPPYLRGAFIADPSIDEHLRRTEPKAHDAWRTKDADGEVDPESAAIAKHVVDRIKQTVNNHRTKLRPPILPPEDVHLPFFNEVMRKVMSGIGAGTRQPIPETRPISIRLDYEPRLSSAPGAIQLVGAATYGLSEHYAGDHALVTLSIAYRFIEDDRVGDHVPLVITPHPGFEEVQNGTFTGLLTRGVDARFEFVSDPYDASWSGRLIVNGEVNQPIGEGTAIS